jgi:hypothetical protein
MAVLVLADRVKETTTTTGTGAVTLAGASPGYQSFASGIGNGYTTAYTIVGQTTAEWEVGTGTYTAAGTTLSRDTVLSSSNAGGLVNFSAGTKDVFVEYPAERSMCVTESADYAQAPLQIGGTFFGRPPIQLYYGLDSPYTGLNQSGAQPMFGVGVNLSSGVMYQFELSAVLSKSLGTTSHTISIGFSGGTAGFNNIGYSVNCRQLTGGGFNTRANTLQSATFINNTAGTTVVTAAISTAVALTYILVKGQVSVSTGGTMTPVYSCSAAPAAAYATQTGSYFKLSALAPAGSNVQIGGWI